MNQTPDQPAINSLVHRLRPKQANTNKQSDGPPPAWSGGAGRLSDGDVLEKLFGEPGGDKWRDVYDGHWRAYYDSQSDADAAIAHKLSFWTNRDGAQVGRIMRGSGLARAKWDSRRGGGTWLENEISRAIENTPEGYAGKPQRKPTESENAHAILSSNAKGTPVERKNVFLKPRDVFAQAGHEPPWVAGPWLARGGVTDLAGAAKLAGKTTMAMCIARAVVAGGWFMGRRTKRSPVVYLSEQGNNVEKALRDACIDENVEDLYILPKRLVLGVPWPSVVEVAVEQCVEVGAKLLVVDTFNRFAGLSADKENNAGDVKDAMDPLIQAAQAHDLAVLCIRHANHEGRGRGSTQFYHDVDVVMTMRAPDATMPANVRVIEAVGRYDGIPARTNVEFREGGLYFDLGSDSKVQATRARAAVKDLLSTGREVVSTDLIRGAVEASGASTGTVNTVLTSMVDAGEIERVGKGRKGDPYRYRTLEILSSNGPGAKAGRKTAEHPEPAKNGAPRAAIGDFEECPHGELGGCGECR